MVPDDDQGMVLPCASVMVIMVLLNEALTCATPEVMFLRSRLRVLPRGAWACSLAIVSSAPGPGDYISTTLAAVRCRSDWQASALGLLLAGDGPRRTLAGACGGMLALAPHGQAAAVAQAAVAAQVHQPLDVHRHLAAQVAFDDEVAIDGLADLQDLGIGQLVHPARVGNADLRADVLGELGPDAVDILERNNDALLRWNVNASNTSHGCLLKRRLCSSAGVAAASTGQAISTTRTNQVPASAARPDCSSSRPEFAAPFR